MFTREIVDVNMLRYHNRFVGLGALEAALTTYAAPEILHSDQGSEYDSADFVELVASCGAQLSMRAKGAPWQNGDKESFSSHFKLEAGDLNRFDTLGELVEFIYQQIYYNQPSPHPFNAQDVTGGVSNETYCLKNRVLDTMTSLLQYRLTKMTRTMISFPRQPRTMRTTVTQP